MPFVNKFKILVCTACLVLVGQGFAADCAANYEAPENAVWDGSSIQEPCTIDGYYIIDNAKKLAWYAKNYKNANARLTADIDLGGKLWTPIAAGKGGNVYGKIFDGNGHIVKNLYINATELATINSDFAQNLGFIAVLGGGTVKNLVLDSVNIQASTNAGDITGSTSNQISVGAVVGWLADKVKINNKDVYFTKDDTFVLDCIASGTIQTTGKGQGVGGIVGNAKVGTIKNCLSLVEVRTSGSQAYVGGIIGIVKTNVAVESCVYAGPGLTNTGTNGSIGGVVGNVYSGTVSATDSYFEGNLTYNGNPVGGVGKNCGSSCSVTNTSEKVDTTNVEKVACAMNGTNDDGSCKEEPWSVGQTGLSLNGYGADGYKIVFKANGGLFANGKNTANKFLQAGMTITADEVVSPSRENYSFAGWALTSDAAEVAENLGIVSGKDTIYAVWNPIYTITFNVAPGTFPSEGNPQTKTKQVVKGDVITVEGLGALPTARCKTYASENECKTWSYFTGWALIEGGSESDSVSLDTVVAEQGKILYAVWTDVETYTVTYNANLHGRTTVDYVRVGDGESVEEPDNPIADEGYKFVGWFTDEDGNNSYSFSTEIHANIILYAKWELKHFDITYVMNNLGSKGENPDKYTIDTAFVLKEPADVEGYKFDGWFYDAGFTKPATQVIQGTTGDISFYAKWSKKQYRIMYQADNNSQGAIKDQFKEHGKAFTLESAGHFNRLGYVQTGWATVANGTKVYDFGASYEENAALTLYPSWDIVNYTITYVCDVCTESNPSKPRTYTVNNTKNGNLSIYNPSFSSNEYEFVGWFWDEAYTQRTTNIPQGMLGDTTLYGKMLKKYTITYILNGGTKANNRTSYTKEIETFALQDATGRENYTFAGWYTNAEFEGDVVTEFAKGSEGDTTFYAKWTPEVYPIVYHNIEGATFETANPETYTVEDENIALNSPAKTGYNFLGWSLEENSTEYVDGIAAGSTGEANFYANWEKVYPFLVNDYGAIKVYEDENGKLTAELDGASSGSVKVITDEDNVVVDKVVLNRTFTVNETKSDWKLATIVLPFTIDQDKISGAEFFEFLDVDLDKNQVTFCNAFDENHTQLVANTPYIVRATAANITFDLAEGETVKLNTSEMHNPVRGTTSKWEFRGTYSYKKWEEGDPELGSVYGYTAKAKYSYAVGQFAKNGAGAFVRPFRANLFKVSSQQARRYPLMKSSVALNTASIDEETIPSSLDVVIVERETEQTTVIGKLNTATGEIKIIDNWFDMKGRKLNGKPTTKGIYYYNGKRVMVK